MPAPSVTRAARLLAELAAHPDDDATLSQLARRLQINKTSCQSLLLALVDEGLVIRGSDRRYRLGSGLISLGEAAKASLRVPELVEPELLGLSGEFGVTALSGVRSGHDLVLIATHEVMDPLGLGIRLGQRLPLQAPFGPVYLAWEAPSAVEAWIARSDPPLDHVERDEAHEVLRRVRSRGCSITVRRPDSQRATAVEPGGNSRDPSGPSKSRRIHMEYPGPTEGVPGWSLLGVGAPVFGRAGEMVCSVAVTAFPFPLGPVEIDHVAARVMASAYTITRTLGGGPVP
jgi:DNA-binding IclR family transcriptional regulator